MSSQIEEIGIRIRADGVVELTNGARLSAEAVDQLGKHLDGARRPMSDLGITAKQTTTAMRQLPAQITDIITSLASGQQPWMVAIQQGGQIKDSFGGIVPAARALLSVLTPVNVAIGAGALAGGALAAAYYQGWQQSRELHNALALTGNQAGITEGQVNDLVTTLAAARNVGAGAVRELMQAVVAGGQTSGSALESTGRAALALSRLTGQSAAESARSFNGMSDGVADWAAQANRAYGYLTVEQYKQIRSLEQQGRTSEAVRLNMDALAGTLESRTAPALGLIERALKSTTSWWGNFWDAAAGVGRPETVDEELKGLEQKIWHLKQVLSNQGVATPAEAWKAVQAAVNGTGASLEDQLAEAERRAETLRRDRARSAMRASDQAAERAEAEQAILRLSRGYQDAMLGSEASANALANANTQRALEERRTLIERAYRQFAVSGERYRDEVIAIERSRLAAEEQLAARAVEIEKSRVIETKGGPAQVEMRTAARDAAVAQAQARLVQLQQERARLQADIDAGRFDPKPREVADTPQQAFRRSELEGDGYGRARDAMQQQLNESKNVAYELLTTNRGLNVDLIRDDRVRAQAQLQLEAQAMRDRLLLQAGSDEERRFKQEQFDEWLVLRQRKVTEDLKPEWQRMLEAWQDTTRLMRESNDSLWTNMLRGGEDAFVQLMTTGSFNAKTLANIWLQEMARVEFRKLAADVRGGGGGLIGQGVRAIGGLLGLGGFQADANTMAGLFHSGGVPAADGAAGTRMVPLGTWARAPRFHTGIGPDEIPAVIQRKEGVFTEGQMKALAPVSAIAQAGGTHIIYSPTYNIDSRTDGAQVLAMMQEMTRQGQAELLDMMDRRMV